MSMKTRRNYIAGEWVGENETTEDINPSDTNDCVGLYARAAAVDARVAIEAAEKAQPDWFSLGIQRRGDILDRIGATILARKDALGELLSREEGKTLPEGIGEASRAGYIFKFFAAESLRQSGDLLESVRPGVDISVIREPLGVVGIITPWNFPIAIPAWKIAPALCYGNAVVFKPAGLVPASAHALAEIIVEAGVPPGVFNLVMGSGGEVGKEIVDNPNVKAISFTGSVDTGHGIAVGAAARQARVQLEMGGKNPLIVLDDADLEIAVSCAVNGAFFSTGQRCTASSRLVVTRGIHERFLEAMKARMQTLVVDHALKEGTNIGPVIDEHQIERNLDYIRIGKHEGAELVVGGDRVERDTPGFYMTPALFTATTPEMRINREEIFGPVASIQLADDYEHALMLANDTDFGLSAGIVTRSLKYAAHFRANAESGMVMVNLPTAGVDYHVPFGGTKGSSFGTREQGTYAKEFYTTVKTTYTFAG